MLGVFVLALCVLSTNAEPAFRRFIQDSNVGSSTGSDFGITENRSQGTEFENDQVAEASANVFQAASGSSESQSQIKKKARLNTFEDFVTWTLQKSLEESAIRWAEYSLSKENTATERQGQDDFSETVGEGQQVRQISAQVQSQADSSIVQNGQARPGIEYLPGQRFSSGSQTSSSTSSSQYGSGNDLAAREASLLAEKRAEEAAARQRAAQQAAAKQRAAQIQADQLAARQRAELEAAQQAAEQQRAVQITAEQAAARQRAAQIEADQARARQREAQIQADQLAARQRADREAAQQAAARQRAAQIAAEQAAARQKAAQVEAEQATARQRAAQILADQLEARQRAEQDAVQQAAERQRAVQIAAEKAAAKQRAAQIEADQLAARQRADREAAQQAAAKQRAAQIAAEQAAARQRAAQVEAEQLAAQQALAAEAAAQAAERQRADREATQQAAAKQRAAQIAAEQAAARQRAAQVEAEQLAAQQALAAEAAAQAAERQRADREAAQQAAAKQRAAQIAAEQAAARQRAAQVEAEQLAAQQALAAEAAAQAAERQRADQEAAQQATARQRAAQTAAEQAAARQKAAQVEAEQLAAQQALEADAAAQAAAKQRAEQQAQQLAQQQAAARQRAAQIAAEQAAARQRAAQVEAEQLAAQQALEADAAAQAAAKQRAEQQAQQQAQQQAAARQRVAQIAAEQAAARQRAAQVEAEQLATQQALEADAAAQAAARQRAEQQAQQQAAARQRAAQIAAEQAAARQRAAQVEAEQLAAQQALAAEAAAQVEAEQLAAQQALEAEAAEQVEAEQLAAQQALEAEAAAQAAARQREEQQAQQLAAAAQAAARQRAEQQAQQQAQLQAATAQSAQAAAQAQYDIRQREISRQQAQATSVSTFTQSQSSPDFVELVIPGQRSSTVSQSPTAANNYQARPQLYRPTSSAASISQPNSGSSGTNQPRDDRARPVYQLSSSDVSQTLRSSGGATSTATQSQSSPDFVELMIPGQRSSTVSQSPTAANNYQARPQLYQTTSSAASISQPSSGSSGTYQPRVDRARPVYQPSSSDISQTLRSSGGFPSVSTATQSQSSPDFVELVIPGQRSSTVSQSPTAADNYQTRPQLYQPTSSAASISQPNSGSSGNYQPRVDRARPVYQPSSSDISQTLRSSGGFPSVSTATQSQSSPDFVELVIPGQRSSTVSQSPTAANNYQARPQLYRPTSSAASISQPNSGSSGNYQPRVDRARPVYQPSSSDISKTLRSSGGAPSVSTATQSQSIPDFVELLIPGQRSSTVSQSPTTANNYQARPQLYRLTSSAASINQPNSGSLGTYQPRDDRARPVYQPSSSDVSQTLRSSGGAPGVSTATQSQSSPDFVELLIPGQRSSTVSQSPTGANNYQARPQLYQPTSSAASISQPNSGSSGNYQPRVDRARPVYQPSSSDVSQTLRSSGGVPSVTTATQSQSSPDFVELVIPGQRSSTVSQSPTAADNYQARPQLYQPTSSAASISQPSSGSSGTYRPRVVRARPVYQPSRSDISQTLRSSGGAPSVSTATQTQSSPDFVELVIPGQRSSTVSQSPTAADNYQTRPQLYQPTSSAASISQPNSGSSGNYQPRVDRARPVYQPSSSDISQTLRSSGGFPSVSTATQSQSSPDFVELVIPGQRSNTVSQSPTAADNYQTRPQLYQPTSSAASISQPNLGSSGNYQPRVDRARPVYQPSSSDVSKTLRSSGGAPSVSTATQSQSIPNFVELLIPGQRSSTVSQSPTGANNYQARPQLYRPTSSAASINQPNSGSLGTYQPRDDRARPVYQPSSSDVSQTLRSSGGAPGVSTATQSQSSPDFVELLIPGQRSSTVSQSPTGANNYQARPQLYQPTSSAASISQPNSGSSGNYQPRVDRARPVYQPSSSDVSQTLRSSGGVPSVTTATQSQSSPDFVELLIPGQRTSTVSQSPIAANNYQARPQLYRPTSSAASISQPSSGSSGTYQPRVDRARPVYQPSSSDISQTLRSSGGAPSVSTATLFQSSPDFVELVIPGQRSSTVSQSPTAANNYQARPQLYRPTSSAASISQPSSGSSGTYQPRVDRARPVYQPSSSDVSETLRSSGGAPSVSTATQSQSIPDFVELLIPGQRSSTVSQSPTTANNYQARPELYQPTSSAASISQPNSGSSGTYQPRDDRARPVYQPSSSDVSQTLRSSGGAPSVSTATQSQSSPDFVELVIPGQRSSTVSQSPTTANNYQARPQLYRPTSSAASISQPNSGSSGNYQPRVDRARPVYQPSRSDISQTLRSSGGATSVSTATLFQSSPDFVELVVPGQRSSTVSQSPTAANNYQARPQFYRPTSSTTSISQSNSGCLGTYEPRVDRARPAYQPSSSDVRQGLSSTGGRSKIVVYISNTGSNEAPIIEIVSPGRFGDVVEIIDPEEIQDIGQNCGQRNMIAENILYQGIGIIDKLEKSKNL